MSSTDDSTMSTSTATTSTTSTSQQSMDGTDDVEADKTKPPPLPHIQTLKAPAHLNIPTAAHPASVSSSPTPTLVSPQPVKHSIANGFMNMKRMLNKDGKDGKHAAVSPVVEKLPIPPPAAATRPGGRSRAQSQAESIPGSVPGSAAASAPPSPHSDTYSQNSPMIPGTAAEEVHDPVTAWRASSAVPASGAPPSRPPSRAPSVARSRREPSVPRAVTPGAEKDREKTFSSTASTGGFTLQSLIPSGPKLSRRASASSRRSDSERGEKNGDKPAGVVISTDSVASLTKKYGYCEKVAIGKGATSVVRLAHKWDRSEEKLYAVKEFRKRRKNETEKEYVKKLTAEFCISSTLHHINVVETVDLVQDEAHHWCEVMEYCAGGDLYAAIKKGGMSREEVECCFGQICRGVRYLHSQGVAHRDIKPENLYFNSKGYVKIGDYGASTVYRLPWEATIHMSTGLCGSEPYIAPEQFHSKPYDARLVDIWATAIVYYCLHFQELPWRVAQPSDPLYQSYLSACVPASSSLPPTISLLSPRSCRPLLRKMLEPDPKQRILIEEVCKDAWFAGIDVCTEWKEGHVGGHKHCLPGIMPSQG